MLSEFLSDIWTLFAEMAPWLLLGFIAAGLIGIATTRRWVARHLSGPGLGPLLKATLFGVPLPLCSCSVIPAGIGFHRQGAHRGATISFLTATPQTGVDSLFLTAAAFGWPFTLIKVATAVVSGVIGGFLAGDDRPVENADVQRADEQATQRSKWQRFLHDSLSDLPAAIALPFTVGVIINAVISLWLEPGTLGELTGGGAWIYFAALAASIPLYVCSTASIPIGLMLIEQGLDLGVVLVFLLAGPATNFATMLIIGRRLGTRALAAYLGSIIVCSLAVAIGLDWIIDVGSLPSIDHEHGPSWFAHLCGVLLLAIFLPSYGRWLRRQLRWLGGIVDRTPSTTPDNDHVRYQLSGLTCQGCVDSAERALLHAGIPVHELSTTHLNTDADIELTRINQALETHGYRADETTGTSQTNSSCSPPASSQP